MPGSLVRVPLRGKLVEGIVTEINTARPEAADIKMIQSVISLEPLLPPHLIALGQFIANYYLCTMRHVLTVLLPTPPWSHLLPETQTEISLAAGAVVKGKKQQLVLDALQSGPKDLYELIGDTEVTMATLKTLQKKNIITFTVRRQSRAVKDTVTFASHPKFAELFSEKRPTLLLDKSVTGRSDLYEQLLEHTLSQGKSALLLCGDILSAKTFASVLRGKLPKTDIILMHGRMTPAEQRRMFRSLRDQSNCIVIGTRSALFAPIQDLGLILIDDEHEWTYKNEQTPRYHVRETAIKLAALTDAKCVFVSATPTLELYSKTLSNKPSVHRATINGANLSDNVEILDLSDVQFGTMYPFTPTLITALQTQLAKKKQSVLFLNHRGIATTVLCRECRKRLMSEETGLPLTAHEKHGKPYLLDQQTLKSYPMPSHCPHCGSARLLLVGAGTQRIEKLLKTHFPTARVERIDRDALEKTNTIEDILARAEAGQIDILVGTASVLKALDLPNVTFAAALIADGGMSLPYFRAGEESVQTLFGIARAMRAKSHGSVLLQTFRPDTPEFHAVKSGDIEAYLKHELKTRSVFGYPPVARSIALLFRGPDSKAQSERWHQYFQKSAQATQITAISRYPSMYNKLLWYIVLRGNDPHAALKTISNLNAVIDTDPQTLL